ncbi:MAG: leucine-rich repeat protein [Paludibacteraceae bacterium]|nr:leucine-rich repeat protein [Paludibacteraceae bacterium]
MEVTIDNIQYELDSLNNTASVIQSEYAGDVVIPAQIHVDGSIYIVNSIENDAFNDCSAVTSIVIPNTVTFIGKFAFYGCSSLTSITIPNSIIKIGGYAFMGCSSLSAITIPSSVTFIGPCAFDSSYLTSIEVETNNTTYDSRNNCNAIIETATNTLIIGCQCTIIPNNITSIGNNAFDGCSSLNRIIIPHSVKKIGEYAFSNCPSLASIKVETGNTIYDSRKDCNAIIETATNTLVVACKNTFIPDNVVSIGDYAFDGCNSLSFITIPDSVKRIGNRAFYKCSSLMSITIPNSIISIGGGAFEDSGIYNDDSKWEEGVLYISNCLIAANENLCSIYTIQDNTRLIGDYAFRYCEALTEIIIPDSVTSIGKYAFTECSSLASIIIPNSVTNIEEGAFHECSSLCSIVLPNGIKSIKCSTFSSCFDLTSIILPNSISRIEDYAFYDCSSLTSITIPSGVTHIDKHAFGSCSFLTSVVIPDSVINIGEGAFEDCIFLKSIIIPNSVTSIGQSIFKGCRSLVSITIPNSIKSIGKDMFADCSSLNSVTISDGVKHIEELAFRNCRSLASITFPKSLNSIKSKAFSGCTSLTSVTIPKNVDNIDMYVFDSCKSLASIKVEYGNAMYDSRENCNAIILTSFNALIAGCVNTYIPNNISIIGAGAFSGCSSLVSITIPDDVVIIGECAFRSCTSLASITLSNNITNIHKDTFYGCSSLTSIIIPNSVTNIEEEAFSKCSSLQSITIPDNVTGIGDRAFEECSSLKSIIIPNTVKSLGNAFRDCTSLASINIPNGVMRIENGTFYNCSSLTSLTIPNSVMNIGFGAFYGCSSLISITIPDSVTNIEERAFQDCSSLQKICVSKGEKARFLEMKGLKGQSSILVECNNEEMAILLNLAKAYLLGIGVSQDITQATQYYIQAAEKGSDEAAYLLAEWYANGVNLTQDINKALQYYEQAAQSSYKDASNQAEQLQRKLEQLRYKEQKDYFINDNLQLPTNTQELTKKYLFFDTECNGLPQDYKLGVSATDNWPRLIQLAWIVTDEEGNEISRKSRIVYPKGFCIEPVVANLTGISNQRAQQEGIDLNDALSEFMEDIAKVEVIIGHNVNFDRHIVGCELYRLSGAYNALMNKDYICTMQSSINYCAIPSNSFWGGYKWPKLEELYRKLFGHMFDNAHDALADVSATKECYFELRKKKIL